MPKCLRFAVVLSSMLVLAPPCRAAINNRGTDFWACVLENRETGAMLPTAILIANASVTPANVRLETSTQLLFQQVIPPGSLRSFDMPITLMMFGTSRRPNAIHVTSDVPVAVYQFNPLDNAQTNDASTLLPVPTLGTAHRIISREQLSAGFIQLPGLAAVIGVDPLPTTVTFVPKGNVAGGFVPATPAGTPITFTLQQFEVAQFNTDGFGQDFTGSLITSDRPVAVFGAHQCSQVPAGVTFCDHLEEQVFPLSAWGRTFVAVKAWPRGSEPDYWRIVASEDGTNVTISPDPVGVPVSLDAGRWIEFPSTQDHYITSDKPIQVAQYFVGRSWSFLFTTGDPAMIYNVPVEQYDTDYLFLTPDTYVDDFVTIVRPTGVPVTLDGVTVPAASFTPVLGSGYDRARLRVSDGVHRVQSTAGVGLTAYGYDQDVSYGYYAGARLDDLSEPITCDAGGPYTAACGGVATIDARASAGPGVLRYSWAPGSPGVSIADPNAAVTTATVTGPGPHRVNLTVLNDLGARAFCTADIVAGPDTQPPNVGCVPSISVVPTSLNGALVTVNALASDNCLPPPTLVNDRTPGGGNASGLYPCGLTIVTFTATDSSGNTAECQTRVTVANAAPPPEVSDVLALPANVPLLVERDPTDPTRLHFTFAHRGVALETFNLYEGTIRPTGMVTYDHVPIACNAQLPAVLPGRTEMFAPLDPGASHYYLVSASNCLDESSLGTRSDGVGRPYLAYACGPL